MKNHDSEIDSVILSMQSRRLKQVYWAVQGTIGLAILLYIFLDDYQPTYFMASLSLLITPTYFLTKSDQISKAANYFLALLSFGFIYMMWTYQGLRDEVMLAWPAIIVFAALIGGRIIFLPLLALFCTNAFLNGYLNDTGLYHNHVSAPSVASAILVTLIISVTAFAVWLLANDMRVTSQKLLNETQRVQASKNEIEKLVNFDQLTGLPNRALARTFYEHSLLKRQKSKLIAAVMFVDLDNFKVINDSLGHQIGDKYLQKIAEKLQSCVRAYDIVCRQGGDEFVIIVDEINHINDASNIAINILNHLALSIVIDEHKLISSCSIGISFCPHDGEDFDTLLKKADLAMYHSKSLGKNTFCFYDEKMNVEAHENIQLISDLRTAIKEKQFVLHYQPKYDLSLDKVIGAEALIRWQHPQKGMIPPNLFISVAEKSGLIQDIGQWVMEEACRTCVNWHKAGFNELHVAVNVSPLQFKRGGIEAIVIDILSSSKLPADKLEIEMTESLLIDDTETLRSALTNLRQLGVTFSIDDFGTGYSNLGYLKKFDIETLKIDQSFTQKINESANEKAIVEAIIQMAMKLDLKTVAEGVETIEQLETIKSMGCTIGQGYFWSKPLPNEKFLALISAQ